jgi:hypothetical protein
MKPEYYGTTSENSTIYVESSKGAPIMSMYGAGGIRISEKEKDKSLMSKQLEDKIGN